MKKVKRGEIYTWESNNIPVFVLSMNNAIDMVTVLTEDKEIHCIDVGNLIPLTQANQDLDWVRLLTNND